MDSFTGLPTSAQVVDKTTRNALDVLDWIGLKHVGKTSLTLR